MADPGIVRQRAGSKAIRLLENIPPALVVACSMLGGVLLIVGSILSGTNSAFFPEIGKKVGYFYEINWSINFIVVIPIAMYFCASAMNCIRQVIHGLAGSKMVLDKNRQPCCFDSLIEDWHRTARVFLVAGSVLAVLAMLASWREWWIDFRYSTGPIQAIMKDTGLLPGWNLAPLTQPGAPKYEIARLFGFFAFTAQGIVAAAYLAFVSLVYAFATWIFRFTTDMTGDELVPDLTSADPRKGFEHLEPFIENLLYAALAFFSVFFLTRLDNAFVTSSAKSISDFMQAELWAGFTEGTQGLFKGSSSLFAMGNDVTYAIAMVGAGMGIAVLTAFLIPAIVVRQAAVSSRDRMIEQGPPRAVTETLQGMVFWPLRYPRPLQLLLLIVLASSCFIFYKLTMGLVGVVIALSVKEFYQAITSK